MIDASDDRLRQWRDTYNEWLMNAALPLWWENGADRERGGFHELLGQGGLPVLAPRRARVQGRQSYVYAVAGFLGWSGPWTEGALHGLNYLNAYYKRPSGLFCTQVSPDGKITNEAEMLYDQAFALMAGAWIARMLPGRTDIKSFALDLLERIKTRHHPAGGFKETGETPFLSNPHMHLFEAALAWHETGDAPAWPQLAGEIARLCLDRFINADTLSLREYFDEHWSIVPGDKGRSVEPGHQFEWAWLLERWSRIGGGEQAHRMARRLFEAGTYGVDKARNVAMDEMSDDFTVRRSTARLWVQTERLKAALILAETPSENDRLYYRGEALSAAEGLWKYLETPLRGLWRDKMMADGSFVEEPAPASSFYHIICAIMCLRQAVDA